MNNTLSDCLSWKEILSSIDKYHKVNSFLVEHDTLMYKNVILPKSWYLCIIRIEIIKRMARGEEQAPISNISKCAREEREAGAQHLEEIKENQVLKISAARQRNFTFVCRGRKTGLRAFWAESQPLGRFVVPAPEASRSNPYIYISLGASIRVRPRLDYFRFPVELL